jgi:hypothetical protein
MRKNKTQSVRIIGLHEQTNDSDLRDTTPAERIGMMWQVALDAWAFKGEPVADTRLPRHVVRVKKGFCKPNSD